MKYQGIDIDVYRNGLKSYRYDLYCNNTCIECCEIDYGTFDLAIAGAESFIRLMRKS
jgi:hypothetical protein